MYAKESFSDIIYGCVEWRTGVARGRGRTPRAEIIRGGKMEVITPKIGIIKAKWGR